MKTEEYFNEGTPFESMKPALSKGAVSRSYFDLEEMATHDGHITISANDYLCGGKWQYYGILSKAEMIRFPRAKNNYLKYIPLKLVECDICKELKYQELMAKRSS